MFGLNWVLFLRVNFNWVLDSIVIPNYCMHIMNVGRDNISVSDVSLILTWIHCDKIWQNAHQNVTGDAHRHNTITHANSFVTNVARSVFASHQASTATNKSVLATTIGRPKRVAPSALNLLIHPRRKLITPYLFDITIIYVFIIVTNLRFF